jgi:hypothetical protein
MKGYLAFDCDVCGKPIEPKTGVLHGTETLAEAVPPAKGFAFWKWDERAAGAEGIGRIHKRCIGAQIQKYLKRFNFGRLELPGARIVITRKKMENRQKRNAD